MASKTPKRPRDPNQLAKLVVDIAIGEAQKPIIKPSMKQDMVALGRVGGLKGWACTVGELDRR